MKKILPLLSALALAPALCLPLTAQTFTWGPSQLDGAGTQNVIAIQPGGTGVILSASDVSGIQRSTDDGAHWYGTNYSPIPAGGPGKVAVICWSTNTTHANTAYAGDSDGFLSSTDGGVTWTSLNSSLSFDGNGTTTRWPRSTGNLIACYQESSWPGDLYAGSVDGTDGEVVRSTDGGNSWTTTPIFKSSDYIRGLALDPNDSTGNTLYVATYGDNVWKTTVAGTATGNGNWTQETASPNEPEELLVLTDGTVFAAGSNLSGSTYTGGIWKSTDGGSQWTSLSVPSSSGPINGGEYNSYLGISGYGSGSTAVIYASASGPAGSTSGELASVIKSANGGSTWTNLVDNNSGSGQTVFNEIGGPGGPSWWQMTEGGGGYELGNTQGDMASIEVDPSDHSRVLTSGRAGVWGSTDSGGTWYPYVNGLSVCVANWACADPNHPGRIYVSDEDWTFFYSTDSGQTFNRNENGMNTGTTGRPIYVNPVNSMVYCGQLDSSSSDGDVYYNADPTTDGNWTSAGFESGTGGANVRGVIAGTDGSGNTVILACAGGGPGAGLWYKDGSGSWTKATGSVVPSGADVVQFAWNPGSEHVFVYAQGLGVWRSNNYGLNSGGSSTWSNVWGTDSSGTGTGFIAEDPNHDGTLYVSSSAGVFRFTDGDTDNTLSGTNMGGPANPGAMTLANGILYCANIYSNPGTNGSMYQWLSPLTSTDSSVISAGVYAGQSQWPSGLAVDGNGTVYISNRDEGCMVGSSLLYADTFSNGSGNWTTDGGTWSVVSVTGGDAYQQSSTSGTSISYINISGSSNWQSYSMSADVTPLTFTSGSVGLSLYFEDSNDRYMLQITPTGTVNIKSDSGGTQTTLASGTYTYASGSTYTLDLVANSTAGTLTAYVNGTQAAQATGITFTPSLGTGALNTYTSSADFSNVLVNQL